MENLEEGYYVSREMSKDIFDKFYGKLNQERLEIARQLNKGGEMISNPEYAIEKALEISSELATV